MRVFLGLAEVSGFYTNLKKGFDEIGVEAELVTLKQHRFAYQETPTPKWVRFAQFAQSGREATTSLFGRVYWTMVNTAARAMLLVWAIIRFDVFMFNCASSFFRFRELPLLKLLGKKVIYNFHGTDGRCGFMDGFAEDLFMPAHLREGSGYIGPLRDGDSEIVINAKLDAYQAITALRKANIDMIDLYADVIINSPSHGQHHTRPFIQRLIVGMPYLPDRDLIEHCTNDQDSDKITILHCPSYPEGKGTPGIRAAIKALKLKGHAIDFIELTGRPNREVLEMIGKCDFVIDQLYSDMAMVGFATEAAFFGKPAIVGGYYVSHQSNDLVSEWIPPTAFCLPEDIEATIEKLIVDVEYRKKLGVKAREFVEQHWLASRSAERILALAKGDYPDEWRFDPENCDYLLGMGLEKGQVIKIMRGLYQRHGLAAFKMTDKPHIEKLIINMVENNLVYDQDLGLQE